MAWLNYPFEKRLNSTGTILGAFITVVSALTLIMLSMNGPSYAFLIRWMGDVRMLTTILMIFVGIGLLSYQWQYQQLSRACGFIILIFGFIITLSEILELNLYGVSNLVESHFYPTLNSAFCFILSGILLLLINHGNYNRNVFEAVGIIGSIVVTLSVLSLFGYASGLNNLYGWVKAIKMSVFAALMFLAFAVSTLSIAWNLLLKNHVKASSLGLSIPIGICFLTVSLSLWYAVRSQDQIFRERTVERESNFVVSNIRYYLDETVQELIRMTNRWELQKGTPEKEWLSDANIALEHQPALQALEVIDKNLKRQWTVTQENQPLKAVPNEILERGKTSSTFTVYLSEERPQDYVIWILNPINMNNQFQGFVTAGINVSTMIDEIYQYSNNTLKEIEIRDNKGTLLFEKNPELNFSSFSIQNFAHFQFQGINWVITAVFDDSTFSTISYIPGITLFLGFFMSGLVVVAFYYSHQSQIKAKELEESLGKLVQTQDRLMTQEKLASLGGLTAGIAHEIKNPLNFINNFSELSISVTDDMKGEIDKYVNLIPKESYVELADLMNSLKVNLKSISDQGKKAQNTIARILAQSRGKTGAPTLTDLHSLIEEYITLSYHGMRSQDPTFNTKFDKQFDPRIDKVEILAEDFSRVLLNLLNNSYYALIEKKKMGGETFRPEVQIITKHLGDRIEITIHDNGTGISEQAREKLFTPFYTTKPVGYGTGLGLSISHEIIVQGHGGILKCDSKEGDYTNFIIQIPVNMNHPLKTACKRSEEEALNLT